MVQAARPEAVNAGQALRVASVNASGHSLELDSLALDPLALDWVAVDAVDAEVLCVEGRAAALGLAAGLTARFSSRWALAGLSSSSVQANQAHTATVEPASSFSAGLKRGRGCASVS